MGQSMSRAPADLPFFPDFFLVGAPRCGTTSLSRYLGAHPHVCFSVPKEPHYFTYVDPPSTEALRHDYLELFFGHYDPALHRAIGEGSVSTLYFPEAVERILRYAPEARFIAMVRNPVEMIPSYHARLLFVLEEDEPDLRRAWELQAERARGLHLPRGCRDPRLLLYANVGRLGHHLEALQRRVDAARLHVIVYDDLVSDTLGVYRRVLDFLGLAYDGRTEFKRKTESRSYRWLWLHRLLYRPPAPVVRLAIRQHRKSGSRGFRLRQLRTRLRKWNRIERPLAPLDPDMRRALRETFVDDVTRLGTLLGRDLSHWMRTLPTCVHTPSATPPSPRS
jgi:Sulfotransferase family